MAYFITLFISVFFLFAPNTSFAKKKKLTLKFTTVVPDSTPWAKFGKTVKKRIIKRSKKVNKDTKIKIKIYMGGTLGGEKSTLRRLKRGEIDLWAGSMGAVSTDIPEFGVLELPFLFENFKEVDKILNDPSIDKEIRILSEKKGYVFFSWAENGFRSFATKDKPVKTITDLKGLKIRAQEQQIYIDTFKHWNASPVPISVPEVLSALNTGIVDAFDQTPLFTFATSWYVSVKHYSLTEHIYQPGLAFFSNKKFKTYPEFLKKIIIVDNWKKVQNKYIRMVRKFQEPLLMNLGKAGVEVHKVSKAERETFKKGITKVYDKFRKNSSKDGLRILKKIQKSLGRKY